MQNEEMKIAERNRTFKKLILRQKKVDKK